MMTQSYGWKPQRLQHSQNENEVQLSYVTDEKQRSTQLGFDLLEAINFNGLLYFLLANLLTGAVNLSTVTMSASTSLSLTLLTAYMLTLSLVVSALHVRHIRIKFW